MLKDTMADAFLSISMNTYRRDEARDMSSRLESCVGEKTAEAAAADTPQAGGASGRPAEQSSRASFTSIVSAATCANTTNAEILNGYVTLTSRSAFLKNHM